MSIPRSYKIRFIEPGIISYNDSGAGVIFVSREALDRMAPSFRNCPVIFVPESHDDSNASTAFSFDDVAATPASGIVAGVPYWGDDGWMWADISIWDEDTQKAIDKGFNVSCAYKPTEETDGGEWHSIPYDGELVNGKYEHLAIVKRPRYEGSQILANSKGGHSVVSIFKKKKNAVPPAFPIPPKKPAAKPVVAPVPKAPEMVKNEADPGTMVTLPSGGEATLADLIAAYQSTPGAQEPLDMDDYVDVDGQQVQVSELVAAYEAAQGTEPTSADTEAQPAAPDVAQNAEDPINTPAEDVVDEKKQASRANSAPAVRMVNTALRNAARQASDMAGEDHPETRTDRLERGASRYSKAVAQGGK